MYLPPALCGLLPGIFLRQKDKRLRWCRVGNGDPALEKGYPLLCALQRKSMVCGLLRTSCPVGNVLCFPFEGNLRVVSFWSKARV
jgi:hypothetical protein